MLVMLGSLFLSDIDGLVDMRLICGITVVRRKAKLGKEDKVCHILNHFLVFCHVPPMFLALLQMHVLTSNHFLVDFHVQLPYGCCLIKSCELQFISVSLCQRTLL